MSNTDLKPVKCPLLKTSKEQLPEADTEACTKQSHESNLSEDKKMSQSSDLSASNLSWKDVLLELQKRNLDKVAVSFSLLIKLLAMVRTSYCITTISL